MRRLLMLGVLGVGLAGVGCATDRQSSTDTAAPQSPTPDLMNANRLQGRNRAPGPFDNQGSPGYDPMTSPQQGVPMTGFQSTQQRMNRPFMGP
jgi:hypothetical protein